MNSRLLLVAIVHTVFSQYGEILSSCLNLMNVPIKAFFNESLNHHYGELSDNTFDTVFSISSSSLFAGLMLGFATMGYMMDYIGRKETAIYIRGGLAITGATLMVLAHWTQRCELFIVGHIIAGIVNALRVVLFIYVAECTPGQTRGLLSMTINTGGVVTLMLVTPLCLPSLLGTESFWFMLPILIILLASAHIFIASHFPQSPKQLFLKNDDENAAYQALDFYYGPHNEIEEEISNYIEEKKYRNEEYATPREILSSPEYRFKFLLVLLSAFIPVFSMVNVKLSYLSSLLISFGLNQQSATTAMMFITAASLPVSMAAPFLIKKFGRRPVFITATLLAAAEWASFAFAERELESSQSSLSWIVACVGSVMGQSSVNIGLLIMSPILISEICPHHTRAAVAQMTQVIPIAFAVVEVAFFPAVRSSIGVYTFLIPAVLCVINAVVLFTMMSDRRNGDFLNSDDDEECLKVPLKCPPLSAPPSYGSLPTESA